MNPIRTLSLAVILLTTILLTTLMVGTADAAPRQHYGKWTYHPTYKYYYRYYYYKPQPTATKYRYNYCIYRRAHPRYVYYYNPYKRKFWGRYDLEAREMKVYSELADEDKREKLEDIPEDAFPAPGPMPQIPESQDGVAMMEPPRDVPTFEDEGQ